MSVETLGYGCQLGLQNRNAPFRHGGGKRRSALCSYERGEGAAAYALASAADVIPPFEMESSAMESTWSRTRVGTTSRYATSS